MTRPTTAARTRAVLDLVLAEREAQEARYGDANVHIVDGTGPDTRWLMPFTVASAHKVQVELRKDYEEFEEETGRPTWVHLVREELAEAFQEPPGPKLAEELVQVAALCVSWVERLLVPVGCEECGNDEGPHTGADGRRYCLDCLEATL